MLIFWDSPGKISMTIFLCIIEQRGLHLFLYISNGKVDGWLFVVQPNSLATVKTIFKSFLVGNGIRRVLTSLESADSIINGLFVCALRRLFDLQNLTREWCQDLLGAWVLKCNEGNEMILSHEILFLNIDFDWYRGGIWVVSEVIDIEILEGLVGVESLALVFHVY